MGTIQTCIQINPPKLGQFDMICQVVSTHLWFSPGCPGSKNGPHLQDQVGITIPERRLGKPCKVGLFLIGGYIMIYRFKAGSRRLALILWENQHE